MMASRLAGVQSAYLRSAAHQPVDWHPWGAEAFARARAEGKPVLLDIGAVWCHWCHVMDRESYESPEVAALLRRDWICIKVDRDERPDVDARYQQAVQALTGQGGWPLTAFLTPDGDVFYGGTYFPPDQRYGRPGFTTLLTELARVYREKREKVAVQAGAIRAHLAEHTVEAVPRAVTEATLQAVADGLTRVFDFTSGGFGTQPKFPHPAALEFLLARAHDTDLAWPRDLVERTLTAMAAGGIHDQLGGGFHRYAVDARWRVPHFEKMLYDNAGLLRAYALAAAAFPDRRDAPWRAVAEAISRWTLTTMADPAGGYFASQDADVGLEDDGDYFTWTVDEAKAALDPSEFAVLARHFDIEPTGEMSHDPARNVLWVREAPAQIAKALGRTDDEVRALIASGRAKLLAARAARPTPQVDRTIYTGWSAMMASALLTAGGAFGREDLERDALGTLERVFRLAGDGATGVPHALGGALGGILDDQVHVAHAALDAYEATGNRIWLERAERLMEHVWTAYAADEGGLYDCVPRGEGGLLDHPIKPIQDAPTPSGNGVGAIVCARLAEHTGAERWRTRHRSIVTTFGGALEPLGLHGATLLLAADWLVLPAAHVAVVGGTDGAGAALRRAARAVYHPRKVVTLLAPGDDTSGLPDVLRAMMDGNTPRAYVCVGPQCAPPATTPDQLRDALRQQ